jgi:DNA mismatch repair protein MutS2
VNPEGNGPSDAVLSSLEFASVIGGIAASATSPPGRAAVLAMRPRLGDRAWAQGQLALVEDAAGFFQSGRDYGFGGAIDTTPLVERAEKGAALSGSDLRRLADTERSLRAAVSALREDQRPSGPLRRLAQQRERTDELIVAIDRAVEEDGRVADGASSELSSIRRQQRALHEQVRERCRSITHSPELAKMLSEPIVTVRAGRYVVPVRSEFAAQFPGVVHDQSASGATVFMEPLASVEANNRLRGLEAAEEREVSRILTELAAKVGEHSAQLRSNATLLAALDSIGARARWSIARDAGTPQLVEQPIIRIVRGRHPLLRHEAVPLDFEIGESFDAVVISGPNMGGKTVVLKTIGLFCLLAYAGIPLPAGAGTVIGEFRDIACVIGDEQSIAQDLSSFSAHLRALKAATAAAGPRSLILVDEIGSGTEPAAGAALAQAAIEAMILARAKIVVTTHFTQLKTFAAAHDRVRNASMLFDPKTHAPTYVFAQGIPGQSLAFALARTLALDAKLIARAETLLGVDAQNLERTFEKLGAERDQLKKRQDQLEEQQRRAGLQERSMQQRIASLEQEKEAFGRRATAELAKAVETVRQQLLEQAQRRSEAAVRQASKPIPQSDKLLAETLQEMRRNLGLESAEPGAAPSKEFKPGDQVYVRSFDQSGVVSEIYGRDVLVTLGNLKTLVPAADVILRAAQIEAPTKQRTSKQGSLKQRTFRSVNSSDATDPDLPPAAHATTEIDVRGMRVDEAWPLVDKALDSAALAGLSELRIIHGRGTGQLSRGIREFLDDHPQVESLSWAPDREGGTGVTVVKLV